MMYTKADVAAAIDHAVLKPELTGKDVISAARMCRERGVCALCVRPVDVALAARELAGSRTKVCAVIGFPHGANRTETKALEARLALDDGALELDMVMHIGRLLSGDLIAVQQDIEAVVFHARSRKALVKVILETCLLTGDQIASACLLARQAGADFVKTSTGFAAGGATPEAVSIMLDAVGDCMQVKASGGIRDWATAVAYLRQGCSRLGVGATEAVLDGAAADGTY
jgi:deoxyribose-phosphate aldolase